MSLIDKMLKETKLSGAAILSETDIFDGDITQTSIPMLNVALGGSVKGGITAGSKMITGPSKHFKTMFCLLMCKAYMKSHDDAVILFYDTEFGTPKSYWRSFGIDESRVLHIPIANIEDLKSDISKKLHSMERSQHVLIFIDSLGMVPSNKEVQDSLNDKVVADMTRAKALKSMARIITPLLKIKDVPVLIVNHTYANQTGNGGQVVSGGTGGIYAADDIWILGREQVRDPATKKILGYNFIINVEKSRYVVEKSKVVIEALWDGGLNRWSGLMDMALSAGVIKQAGAWYALLDPDTGKEVGKKFRKSASNNGKFWRPILAREDFQQHIEGIYKIPDGQILKEGDGDEDE